MSTQAQINANRANAQKSTGPTSPEGKAKSSSNAVRHGLLCEPTTLFASDPHEQTQFNILRQNLFQQCLPEGEMETQTFERYAFSMFQMERAREFEIDAQQRWVNEPNEDKWFRQMERMIKLTALLERRADKALAELGKLQRDRFNATDVQNELYLMKAISPIPASLPVSQMRATKHANTPTINMAMMVGSAQPDIQAILKGEVPPPEMKPISQQEKEDFFRSIGR